MTDSFERADVKALREIIVFLGTEMIISIRALKIVKNEMLGTIKFWCGGGSF